MNLIKKNRRCVSQLKKQCSTFHKKCDHSKRPAMVCGAVLNDLLTEYNCLEDRFDDDVDYKVCASTKGRLKKHEVVFNQRKRALEALARASQKVIRRSK